MSAQADSLFSLGPIVAAQHVSVPLVSERSGDSAEFLRIYSGKLFIAIKLEIFLSKIYFY